MALAYVAVGLMTFLAASTLAIDVGMLMTARSQAQNSADAGALAGAIALALDDYDDRTASGPAVQSAVTAATENEVMQLPVSVTAGDVTFPIGPAGLANRVRVQVQRSAARSNPLDMLMGGMFGLDEADISAHATAEASPANAMTCVKPFTIPDRWIENTDGPWTTESTFDRYDKKGKLLPDADEYIPPGQPGYAGYAADRDRGTRLTIRAGTGNNIQPTFYYSWKMPGDDIGADYYRENVAGCNPYVAHFGELMTQEPGNMMGPTVQGVEDLIAQDPTAVWDSANNRVQSPLGSRSPRIFPIPLYDPEYYATGTRNGRAADLRMANWIGFFVESVSGNNVIGRITPILGTIDNNAGPAPEGIFPLAIRLVQ